MEEGNKDLNRRVVKKVREIAEHFTNNRFVPKDDPGLFGGKTGLALFLFYYSLEYGDQRKYNKAVRIIINVLKKDLPNFNHPSFSDGISGIGWTMDYIKKNKFLELRFRDFYDTIDKFVYIAGKEYIRNNNWDYLHGAIGTALYFLRRDTTFSLEYLNFLVDEMYSRAEFTYQGIFWRTYLISLNTSVINLGLAHGLAGILLFLCRAYLKGVNTVKTIRLIQGICEFLIINQQNKVEMGSFYPNWIFDPKKPEKDFSRLAWCYGDIGIGYSLFMAGEIAGNYQWTRNGLYILKNTCDRTDIKKNNIMDAGFCHGSAGLAYIYKKLYLLTDHKRFLDTSDFWLETTLDFAKFEDGIAGYKTYRPGKNTRWVSDPGLLGGIAGIGLTLMYCSGNHKQSWDECLLLS